MTPELLNLPFIGIKISKDDYPKVRGMLPTPSYEDILRSYSNYMYVLIYVVDGYITSSKQYKWMSDIKFGLKEFLFISYDEVEEFYITESTECNNIKYSLNELKSAFNAKYLVYPRIWYPETKKALYRHILIHGKKLKYKKLFTFEAMMSAALIMNHKLYDKYQLKEIYKITQGAYQFILENAENFPEKLSRTELKKAYSKGARITNSKRSTATQQLIHNALKTGKYFKANGKVNKTLLSLSLNVSRPTIDKYLKKIAS